MRRDALHLFRARARRDAEEAYRHAQSLYVAIAPHSTAKLDPPVMPDILQFEAQHDAADS